MGSKDPLSHCTLTEPSAELAPSYEGLEPTPMLWPLPSGGPIFPIGLQAVPYPTFPELRPPLSPPSVYQHDHGPGLPHIAELIDGAPQNYLPSPESLEDCAMRGFDEDMIDEGYEEGHESPLLTEPVIFETTPWEAPHGYADDRAHRPQSLERRYGTPLETYDGCRMGLMRFHQDDHQTQHFYQGAGRAHDRFRATVSPWDSEACEEAEREERAAGLSA